MIFIDTNVAIDLRDNEPGAKQRIIRLRAVPILSIISRLELESGVHRDPAEAEFRRRALDMFLDGVEVELLDHGDVAAYGRIVQALGFNRRLVLDRLIAAQVVARGGSLVTANLVDFAEIPGLRVIPW